MDPGIISALAVLEAEPDNADALAQLAALAQGGGNGHGRGSEQAAELPIRRALTEARRIHRERGDYELVARLIDLELGWETDKGRQADLYFEKGKILADELLREKEAVAAFDRVLELRPDDEGAQETLSTIALVRDNWKKIVKKYLDEAKDSTDRQLTTSLYLSVAEIYAKYEPDDHVESYLKKAIETDPRNTKASLRLERLYRAEQRWEELSILLEQRIEAAPTKEERAQAYLHLADVQAKKLGKRAEASESYKKALGIDPANLKAMRALVDFYTAEENWQSLVRVYENALRARPRGEPEQGMLVQLGMLWWRKLGNLESADEYWKRVRKSEPAHLAMLSFYRELYGREPAKLIPVLQQAQKVEADPGRRIALAVELAQLADKAGTVEKAIELWKAVIKLDPTQNQATAALRRLYERTEKWNALLELLKERVEALPKNEIDQRVQGLLEVVAIYRDKLNLDVMVINTYNNVLSLKPDHTGALAALAEKYEKMGRWNDLITILGRTVEAVGNLDEKAALLRRIAALWIDKFGNFNQAVRPLEELYALRPDSGDTATRLRDIYARRRSWRALIDLERKELERIPQSDFDGRRAKLIEMAKIAIEKLGDARESIGLWNRILEANDGDLEALQALAALYEREKRWAAHIEILRRQRDRMPDAKAQVALLERIGVLFTERLNAPEPAIATYQEIVKLQPSHQKAMRTLRELYAQGGRFSELERLYAENKQFDELCEVLLGVAERMPGGAESVARKLQLYFRVAEIAQRELKSPERAAKAYERILALDASNREAANALVPIYRAGEKWARLLATYEIVLAHAPDDDAKLALHREITGLCEDKLGSKGLAFSWCAKAYALRPNDPQIGKELERLALEAEAWEELAELYTAQVGKEKDPAARAARNRQLGRITLNRLRRHEEARKHFEAVLEHAPEDEEALNTLEQIFNQTQEWSALLGIHRRRVESAKDPARRVELLFKIAQIEEAELADQKAAIATYRRILESDPVPQTQLRALHALEKLSSAGADAGGLHDVLSRQLQLVGNDADAKVALLVQLGALCEKQLGRPDEALAHYKNAFALQPLHKQAQSALERWLGPDKKERVEVARLLAPVYEQRNDFQKQLDALEILLGAEKDARAQLSLYRRLAAIAGDAIGDWKKAYEYTGAIFERQPDDSDNRIAMARLADTLECPDDLAVRLGKTEEQAAKDGKTQLACDLAWDLGQLCDVRLSMPDEAERAYKRVMERDPDHEGAHVALVQLYSGNERWKDLRALFELRKTRAKTNEERLQLLYGISDLDEGVLEDAEAASRDYHEALELDPGSTRSFKALDRLYSQMEKWRELDELLGRRVPYAPNDGSPESRANLKYRRGELHALRLGDAIGATDLYEETLNDEPKHDGAKKGLEALMKRPELRQRIARALEPLYIADEAWSKLALVLGAQREVAEGVEAAQLLARLAELQEERLGARQLALTTWREALRIAPGEANVRENVERLASLLGRHGELAQAWEEAFNASNPSDLSLRAELLEKAATIYELELGDFGKARAMWQRLLELDPANQQASKPAAEALARLYQAAEAWPELISVLHRQSEWAQDPRARKELLFRIGRIQEELLVEPQAAIGTYREILAEDPEERAALDALERLYLAQQQWTELVEILRKRADLAAGDADLRRDLLWRIAQLTERELADTSEAIVGYNTILDEKPEDVPAIEALLRLFEAQKRSADLLDMLERRLAIAEKSNQRDLAVPLRMKISALLVEFGRRDQALERYREVLEREPKNAGARAGLEKLLDDEDLRLRAAEVLEGHYQTAGETDKLVGLGELFAKHTPDARDKVARLRQVAALKEQRKDVDGAFDALSRAARAAVGDPDLPPLLDGLERLAHAGIKPQLVALYRELGPDIMDAQVQERVYLTIAQEANAIGDRATAREYYRRVLDATPDHPRALDAVEQLYADGREHEPLFEIYAQRSEMAQGDDDRRRHYLLLLAKLSATELDRPSDAMRAYEQVLEMFPADADASKELEQLYVAGKRWVDLAELLERRLGFADDLDEAVALRFRLAQIYDDEIQDEERGVENYRATLGGDPNHAGAIAALERYLDDPNQRVSAAEVLEPVYVARHDWPHLVRIYQIRLEAADDHRVRLGLTRRIARLHEEQLEDLEGAFTWYGKVFREEPGDRSARDQLARLANNLQCWPKLAQVFEDYLSDVAGEQSQISVDILRLLASIYQDRINDVDGARKCYQRLLEINPSDDSAFQAEEKLLIRAERWRDLLDVYREATDASNDGERRKTLLFKQAAIVEEKLEDAPGAIDLYRAILDLDPVDRKAINALERLYTDGKKWHDLVELLIRQLDGADDQSWIVLKLRLGGIYEGELEDKPTAIDTYEEILQRAPTVDEAVRALERLIIDSDHTFRIAQILEPIYRAEDAWQKLVVIYDAELEYIDDHHRRNEILREIAKLHETRGGDARLAFNALQRGFREEVEEGGADEAALYGELNRLARLVGLWKDLVTVLEETAQKTYDSELQATLYERVAGLREGQLNDVAGAIDSWRKVTAAKDDHEAAWQALDRLLEKEGRNDELVTVLEKRGSLSNDLEEQKTLATRAAELYEGPLEDPEQAISTWQKVLNLDENDAAALDALERLYTNKKAFRDLSTVLSRKIELASDAAKRRELRFALARVSEKELNDQSAAIESLRGVVAEDGRDEEALRELARLYAGEKQWADHLEVLDLIANLLSGEAQAGLRLQAATVLEEQMGDAETAIQRYQAILDGNAGASQDGARAALERLVKQESTRDLAADVLEPFYSQAGDNAALVELTELRLGAASDPSERRALLARIAELNESGLNDLQAAFVAYGRILAEDAGDEDAQKELERLTDALGTPDELARVYEERLKAAFDPEVQRALAWKLGQLYETKLGSSTKAIDAYEKAMELPGSAGGETGPLVALDRLLQSEGRWRELADVLEKEAAAENDPAAQSEFLVRLGALRLGELGDLDGALTAFRDAIERAPDSAGGREGLNKLLSSPAHVESALDLLEPLYEADGEHGEWVRLAEVRLGITDDKHEKVALLERIAERAANELRDPAAALGAMERALPLRPDEPHLAEEVERLAEAAGNAARAGEIFEAVIEGGVPSEVGRDLGLRAARLWDRLDEDERAEKRYLAVLEIEGDNADALEALERIYRGREDAAKLAEILERRAREELDVDGKKKMLSEAARLHSEALNDPERAIDVWRKLLEVDDADTGALDALAALFEKQSRWADLVESLQQKARFVEDPAEQLQLKFRIAEIYDKQLEDTDKAVESYRDIIDHQPDSLDALSALEDLETRREDWTAVQETLVRRLNAVGGGPDQIPVYLKLAQLAVEKHKSTDDAIGYLHEVLAIEPEHAQANQQLTALLEQSEKWHDLIDVITQQADRQSQRGDTKGEIALLVRVADLWEQKLGSPESATEILERILERDPSSVRALTTLARIYEGQHDLEKCKETLERAAELATTGEEAAELHYRMGRLEAGANGEEAGESYFLRALDSQPSHKEASAALEAIARNRGDFERLADLLAAREEYVPEKERRAFDIELANLYSEKLKQPQKALPYLERAVKLTPDDPAVLEPLADLYLAAGREAEALPLYKALVDKQGKGKRGKDQARLHFRIAQIAERTKNPTLALEEYNAAYAIDPGHTGTLAALGRIYMNVQEWDKARRIYRAMLLANLDPAAGVSKADVYLHLGEIHEKLNEGPKAAGMYERGLELEPAHAPLKEALARVRK